MTLEEMKIKVFSLIEEYSEDSDTLTEDEDLATKMNNCVNMIMNEMSRLKKINAFKELEVTEENKNIPLKDIDENIYQLNIIKGIDYELIGDRIIFNDEGKAEIYYYKYPTQINNDTQDNYKFELDTECLEIMPYGIAGLLLASDVSNNYGQIYSNLYREKVQQLDSRKTMPYITISGGIEV